MKKFVWLFPCLLVAFVSVGQNKELDSLNILLKDHPQEDTIRATLLTDMCTLEYYSFPEQNKAHAEEALNNFILLNASVKNSECYRVSTV